MIGFGMSHMLVLAFVVFCACLPDGAHANIACGGRPSPVQVANLQTWNLTHGSDLLKLLEGHWYVVSSINWFERGWSCFEGRFERTADARNLTCSWTFKVPVLGQQRMTDQLSFPDPFVVEELNLKSLSMPSFLRSILGEEQRPVRLLGMSPPPAPLSWVVLFDCANWVTPTGELFVLSRASALAGPELSTVRQLIRDNGVRDFTTLHCADDHAPEVVV